MSGGSGGSPAGAIFGGFFNMASTMRENSARKNYLIDVEDSYNMDAAYQEKVGKRKMHLLQRDQTQYYDRMVSQLAQAGISFDGSAVDVLADTGVEQAQERHAVQVDTDMRVEQSRRKAASARTQRYDITDNEPMDFTMSFFGGAGRGYSSWGGGG